jgi:hypothetical protein
LWHNFHNDMKKYLLIFFVALTASDFVLSQDEPLEQRVHLSESMEVKAWYWGGLLLTHLKGEERMNLEIEICGAAFSYFLVQESDAQLRCRVTEYHIKEIFLRRKLIRDELIHDPLCQNISGVSRRAPIHRRGMGMRNDAYLDAAKRFVRFLDDLEVEEPKNGD